MHPISIEMRKALGDPDLPIEVVQEMRGNLFEGPFKVPEARTRDLEKNLTQYDVVVEGKLKGRPPATYRVLFNRKGVFPVDGYWTPYYTLLSLKQLS